MAFKDRIYKDGANPNLKRVVPVAGEPNVYQITDISDNIEIEGTALTAETFNSAYKKIEDDITETRQIVANATNVAIEANKTSNLALDLFNQFVELLGNPVTAGEFNAFGLTAVEFDSKQIIVGQFDILGKTILGGI